MPASIAGGYFSAELFGGGQSHHQETDVPSWALASTQPDRRASSLRVPPAAMAALFSGTHEIPESYECERDDHQDKQRLNRVGPPSRAVRPDECSAGAQSCKGGSSNLQVACLSSGTDLEARREPVADVCAGSATGLEGTSVRP